MKKLLTIAFAFGLIYLIPQQNHANLYQEQEEEVEVVEMPVEEVQEEPQMTVAEAPSVGFTQELKNRFIEGGPGFMGIVLACLILGLAIAIERIIYLNFATTNTEKLVEDIESALKSGGVDSAKEICRNTPGPVASIFYQGLDRAGEGVESAEKAVSSGEDSGRSEALSLLILDEAAFIDKIDTIWAAASQTLSTGGQCIALSTPNGVGNWFHRTWMDAEDKLNDFNFIKLHWTTHPERGQEWKEEQDTLLGPSLAAQECDCDFITSGQSVVDGIILEEYREKQVKEPIEKRGIDSNVWIWEPPNYTKDYVVCADVSRGDATDYSAFHILDVETLEQVAEYKGRMSTRDYGNLLVNIATEYNNALLVIENNNIGWAAIQQCIDREYDNLFYMSKDLQVVDVHKQINNKINRMEKQLVPGFTITSKTRPLVVSKLEEFFRERAVTVYSQRLIDELFVFIYNGSRAEAMSGYNDDLVMSFAMGLWIRETALRLRAQGIELQKKAMNSITSNQGVYTPTNNQNDSWTMEVNKQKESIEWLIN